MIRQASKKRQFVCFEFNEALTAAELDGIPKVVPPDSSYGIRLVKKEEECTLNKQDRKPPGLEQYHELSRHYPDNKLELCIVYSQLYPGGLAGNLAKLAGLYEGSVSGIELDLPFWPEPRDLLVLRSRFSGLIFLRINYDLVLLADSYSVEDFEPATQFNYGTGSACRRVSRYLDCADGLCLLIRLPHQGIERHKRVKQEAIMAKGFLEDLVARFHSRFYYRVMCGAKDIGLFDKTLNEKDFGVGLVVNCHPNPYWPEDVLDNLSQAHGICASQRQGGLVEYCFPS